VCPPQMTVMHIFLTRAPGRHDHLGEKLAVIMAFPLHRCSFLHAEGEGTTSVSRQIETIGIRPLCIPWPITKHWRRDAPVVMPCRTSCKEIHAGGQRPEAYITKCGSAKKSGIHFSKKIRTFVKSDENPSSSDVEYFTC
jgi:hypothetical protein